MIDKNASWNGENLYLWNGKDTLFCISEGTGDNLLDEDIEQGYVDYWITEWFEFGDGVELNTGGGQWMETELIRDKYHTVGDVLDRMMECDLWEENWELLDEEIGDELFCRFDELTAANAKCHTAEWRVKEYVKRLG